MFNGHAASCLRLYPEWLSLERFLDGSQEETAVLSSLSLFCRLRCKRLNGDHEVIRTATRVGSSSNGQRGLQACRGRGEEAKAGRAWVDSY